MNWFEYLACGFVLTANPTLIFSKRVREERRYVLTEIKQGRGIL